MKKTSKLILIAALALLTLLALPAFAQTNTIPVPLNLDVLTNLPNTTNFSAATIGLETGVAVENGQVANYIKGDFYIRTNWMISGEIQNAPVSTVLDSASLYFGYRKQWSNAELYAQIGARRVFTTDATAPCWRGAVLLGTSWYPITGGKFALTASTAFLTAAGNPFNQTPGWEVRAGAKLCF